jgi:hypothetical protein
MFSMPVSSSSVPSDAEIFSNLGAYSAYEFLLHSIPNHDRTNIKNELESQIIIEMAKNIGEKFVSRFPGELVCNENTRDIFLAALLCVKQRTMSTNQLASLHLLDAAVRTLYSNPVAYLVDRHKSADHPYSRAFIPVISKVVPQREFLVMHYDSIVTTNFTMPIEDLPEFMQPPLMKRFFNFNEQEWNYFCDKMSNACESEKYFSVLVAPEGGCWSAVIAHIQILTYCMPILNWLREESGRYYEEFIMLAPSFTMLQEAINAKANTLKRTPIELIPSYDYLQDHQVAIRSAAKIVMPERDPSVRNRMNMSNFRRTIDGHFFESTFAGALRSVHHALREMMMLENVAKARMHLAKIAEKHPHNILALNKSVSDILIEGTLIFSYPVKVDTIFNPAYRPKSRQTFGDLFYADALKDILHADLKRAFIEDMVINEQLWKNEFKITKSDLLKVDREIFDAINLERRPLKSASPVGGLGVWSNTRAQKRKMEQTTTSDVDEQHDSGNRLI